MNKNLQKNKLRIIIILLIISGIAALLLSLCSGATKINPLQLIKAIFSASDSTTKRIFYYARLPRTVAAFLAGAGLATSGAIIQNVLANRLASPGIIGVNAGAGLGVTICCAIGAYGGLSIAGASFIGALATVLLVTFLAQATGASRSAVILGGVAINSFLTAVSEGITTIIPEINLITSDFKVGGFSGVSSSRLLPAAIIIILSIVIVFSLSNELDLLSMGEETAQGLGLSAKKARTIFLTLAALLAGASVSFAGLLGFVGLIIPNLVKKLVGSESKKLLPLCAAFGAVFVTLCDCVAKTLFAPHEIPTGIVMSVIGAPFFIFLIFRSRGGHAHG